MIDSAQRFEAEQVAWQSYQLAGIGGGFSFKFMDPFLKTRPALDHQPVGERAMVGLRRPRPDDRPQHLSVSD